MALSATSVVDVKGQTSDKEKKRVAVSIVVTVTERYDRLDEVYEAHAEVLRRAGHSFEFVFVIDAGYERTGSCLDSVIEKGHPVRKIVLPRNFGEATALAVGLEQASGNIIITVPSYFQVEPDGIGKILDLLNEGYDLVVVKRSPRRDSWINRLQSAAFHLLFRRMTGINFQDMGCGLRGLRKRVVSEINLYGDLHRFIPVLAYQRGFRVTEAAVPQHPKDMGIRVYRPGLYLRRLLDILTVVFLVKFTQKPLRFFGLIGCGLFAAGLAVSLVLTVERIMGLTALADRPLLILGVLLMVLGIQVGSIGLLGETIIFTHARRMKDYRVDQYLR
jgi:glycosyltransferase involved in cell wall biosynthesis